MAEPRRAVSQAPDPDLPFGFAVTPSPAWPVSSASVPSMSCRTVVYKGLVAGGRLKAFYPDLAAPIAVSYALFHQRYATNTQPTWRLAQPFRSLAHNGEIDTVRGNREQVRGRRGDTVTGRSAATARALVEAGPLEMEAAVRSGLAGGLLGSGGDEGLGHRGLRVVW